MQIRKSVLILIIVAACLASYFNALFGGFVWDDDLFIIENPYVKSFQFLPQFFTKDFWSVYFESMPSPYYRPLLAASFMLDYSLWKENPLGFHITNLIFHILCCISIFVFVGLLIKDKVIAFTSSLLFAVHPIHTEAVSFISGRVDVLPCAFFLFSLILFLKYVFNKRLILYLLSLVCFSISLLNKEMAITLPLIVICIDYIFLSQRDTNKVIKNFWSLHLGFFVILGLYLFVRSYIIGWSFITEEAGLGLNFLPGKTYFWRIFTALKIITFYIRLLFLPCNLSLGYIFSPANSLFEPLVLIGAILLSLFMFAYFRNIKRYPILSFSIAWFIITFLPVSNILPLGNIFAERYMYIPSVGFCIGMGFLFSWLLKKDIKTSFFTWRKSITFVSILLIVALGRVTYERNKVWESDFTLWSDTVEKSPNNALAYHNLGNVYYGFNLLDKALREYNLALRPELNSSSKFKAHIFYKVGHTYLKKELIDESIKAYKIAIEMNPDEAEFYNSLAVVYGLRGRYEESIEAGLTAIEKDPYLEQARYNLALNYKYIGFVDKAIDAYEEFLRISPKHYGVHLDVGYLYYERGDYRKAKEHWFTALEISPDYQPAKEALKLLEE